MQLLEKYRGAGPATAGTTAENPAEGEHCAYIEATEWYDLGGRDWINVALMQGNSNGFTAPEAYEALPLTKYRVRFKIRGDVEKVQFEAVGWSAEVADSGDRQRLYCRLTELKVTAEWREYERSFITAANTKRFA